MLKNIWIIYLHSPVARGFLAGQHQETTPNDWRASVPYMSGENLKENTGLVKEIEAIAAKKGITLAQLSLAWVINQGCDVFPIPGTTKLNHLEDNIKASEVNLTSEEMELIGNGRVGKSEKMMDQCSFRINSWHK